IVEARVKLLPKPEGLLSGIVFFESEQELLKFVAEARETSLRTRGMSGRDARGPSIDARALEDFDSESLGFLRQKYETVPAAAAGAVFFEQETTLGTEDDLMSGWLSMIERHHALAEGWFATNEQDQAKLREFRHQLPVLMNEWFSRHN